MSIDGEHMPFDPDKPTVLTFYIPFTEGVSDLGHPYETQSLIARTQLFAMPYREIESSLRNQLAKTFGPFGFDHERDISAIVTNRWGHAYVIPQKGFFHGLDGEEAPRDVVRRGYGRIRFAHSELTGDQLWSTACDEGERAGRYWNWRNHQIQQVNRVTAETIQSRTREPATMRLIGSIVCFLLATTLHAQQEYPNVEGETLLEDDRVVVQRFVLEPGEWEGIHEHPEHQLVIVLNSTEELVYRFRGSERVFERTEDDDVRAFWRPGPVFMSNEHESGNMGTRPLEWIAITFKTDSVRTEEPPEQFVQPESE